MAELTRGPCGNSSDKFAPRRRGGHPSGLRRRAIVVMHELEGMPPEAIARVLGVTKMTVQWHLSMARRELRKLLKAHVGGTR